MDSLLLGGTGSDRVVKVLRMNSGQIVLVGYTDSVDWPVTPPSIRPYSGGDDVFVAVIEADLSSVVTSTVLGGTGDDQALTALMLSDGSILIAGGTDSPAMGSSRSAQHLKAGAVDGFLAVVDLQLQQVMSWTYLGGSNHDVLTSLAVSPADNSIQFAGFSSSSDLAIVNADQPQLEGSADAILGSVSSDLSKVEFLTYMGGMGSDLAYDLAVDSAGHSWIGGKTSSPQFPGHLALGPLGEEDGFIVEVRNETIVTGLRIGGSSEDDVRDIEVDGDTVWVQGTSASSDLPLVNPIQQFGGQQDAWLAALRRDGSMSFGTWWGGSGLENTEGSVGGAGSWIRGIAVDGDEVIAIGNTDSSDFPAGAAEYGVDGGFDAYVVAMRPAEVVRVPTPTPTAPQPPEAAASACRFLDARVPLAHVRFALANPALVIGWNDLCNPGVPPSIANGRRHQLTLLNPSGPFHPLFNPLVYRCGCR
jgi:hypothetical protein